MSTYLDQLIKTVKAEVTEEETRFREQKRIRRFPSKRAGSGLKRALQRLEVLKSLRKAERGATHLSPNQPQRRGHQHLAAFSAGGPKSRA